VSTICFRASSPSANFTTLPFNMILKYKLNNQQEKFVIKAKISDHKDTRRGNKRNYVSEVFFSKDGKAASDSSRHNSFCPYVTAAQGGWICQIKTKGSPKRNSQRYYLFQREHLYMLEVPADCSSIELYLMSGTLNGGLVAVLECHEYPRSRSDLSNIKARSSQARNLQRLDEKNVEICILTASVSVNDVATLSTSPTSSHLNVNISKYSHVKPEVPVRNPSPLLYLGKDESLYPVHNSDSPSDSAVSKSNPPMRATTTEEYIESELPFSFSMSDDVPNRLKWLFSKPAPLLVRFWARRPKEHRYKPNDSRFRVCIFSPNVLHGKVCVRFGRDILDSKYVRVEKTCIFVEIPFPHEIFGAYEIICVSRLSVDLEVLINDEVEYSTVFTYLLGAEDDFMMDANDDSIDSGEDEDNHKRKRPEADDDNTGPKRIKWSVVYNSRSHVKKTCG